MAEIVLQVSFQWLVPSTVVLKQVWSLIDESYMAAKVIPGASSACKNRLLNYCDAFHVVVSVRVACAGNLMWIIGALPCGKE